MKGKNCLDINIPEVDETLLECTSFTPTKCVIDTKRDMTQDEINKSVFELQDQVKMLIKKLNTDLTNNIKVKELNLGPITETIKDYINNNERVEVSQNEILVVKAEQGGVEKIWMLVSGKGVYGQYGTPVSDNNFINIV